VSEEEEKEEEEEEEEEDDKPPTYAVTNSSVCSLFIRCWLRLPLLNQFITLYFLFWKARI
jgi:hypothetical protein